MLHRKRVISTTEHQIMLGNMPGSKAEKAEAVRKLEEFQATKTDPLHVRLINSLIPGAEAEAKEMWPADDFDRAFHTIMNRLTRQAGLRCR